ncbi:LysR family transcriptional regulator, partial [Listeria monocytogenes]|nr:LysR family transcriptional regulator [Listeria monocytogenes]HDU7554930.1 LysR family transcriptional regulator [Listeria monocytogenes]
GTLEDKYNIKIMDIQEERNDQNIVAAINKQSEITLLQELFSFIKSSLLTK